MAENDQATMTIVTCPDYHVEPDAQRIVVLGPYHTRMEIQDAIGLKWPEKPVSLYMGDGKHQDEIDWLLFQLSIAHLVFVDPVSIWDWVWPMLLRTDANILFKHSFDQINYKTMNKSLKLAYPGQVFESVDEIVEEAISRIYKYSTKQQ